MAGALVAVGCSASTVLGGCAVISGGLVKAPVRDLVLTVAEIPYPGFVVEHGAATAGYYNNARVAGTEMPARNRKAKKKTPPAPVARAWTP